jgi:hypothetical protein
MWINSFRGGVMQENERFGMTRVIGFCQDGEEVHVVVRGEEVVSISVFESDGDEDISEVLKMDIPRNQKIEDATNVVCTVCAEILHFSQQHGGIKSSEVYISDLIDTNIYHPYVLCPETSFVNEETTAEEMTRYVLYKVKWYMDNSVKLEGITVWMKLAPLTYAIDCLERFFKIKIIRECTEEDKWECYWQYDGHGQKVYYVDCPREFSLESLASLTLIQMLEQDGYLHIVNIICRNDCVYNTYKKEPVEVEFYAPTLKKHHEVVSCQQALGNLTS